MTEYVHHVSTKYSKLIDMFEPPHSVQTREGWTALCECRECGAMVNHWSIRKHAQKAHWWMSDD